MNDKLNKKVVVIIPARSGSKGIKNKNIISQNDIQSRIEKFDSVFPFRGISVVSKAWVDADFRELLLIDAKSAIKEIGIDLESFADIICFAQCDEIHHIVVCTLCSCYPRTLLGMPPSWYKSRSYRSRVVPSQEPFWRSLAPLFLRVGK